MWRVVQTGNVGLFHVVGAGKTAVCVIASMEMRRPGLPSRSPAMWSRITCSANTRPSSCACIRRPGAHGGRRIWKAIAGASWCRASPRAIGTRWSSRTELRAHPDVAAVHRHITEVIHEIEMAVRAEKSGDRSNRIIKAARGAEEELEGLERLLADKKKDDPDRELLGIDGLFVDEGTC